MNLKKDPAENSIVDFIDDDEYYQIKKEKQQVENGTWAIYIFTGISFLGYTFYVLKNTDTFEWINFLINLIVIVAYLFLASYSSDKPYTAFIATLCVVGFVFLLDTFYNSQIGLRGIIIKIILIVYISMRFDAAKKVQAYENAQKSKKR